jgi:hypothetical protein
VPYFVQSEACLPCSLYDGEPMEHRAVVAPLTTDPVEREEVPQSVRNNGSRTVGVQVVDRLRRQLAAAYFAF